MRWRIQLLLDCDASYQTLGVFGFACECVCGYVLAKGHKAKGNGHGPWPPLCHGPCRCPLAMVNGPWPWPLAMPPGHGQWPWPLAKALGHGPEPWPLALAPGQWTWPLVIARGQGPWPWLLGMAPGHGQWPLPLAMALGHGPWPRPLAMVRGSVPNGLGLPAPRANVEIARQKVAFEDEDDAAGDLPLALPASLAVHLAADVAPIPRKRISPAMLKPQTWKLDCCGETMKISIDGFSHQTGKRRCYGTCPNEMHENCEKYVFLSSFPEQWQAFGFLIQWFRWGMCGPPDKPAHMRMTPPTLTDIEEVREEVPDFFFKRGGVPDRL